MTYPCVLMGGYCIFNLYWSGKSKVYKKIGWLVLNAFSYVIPAHKGIHSQAGAENALYPNNTKLKSRCNPT